jgi:hypothetical protein
MLASQLLLREVDAVDLILIELLHRFCPPVYDLVAKNSIVLTGGESLVRGGPLRTEEDEREQKKKFFGDLGEVSFRCKSDF